MLFNNTIFSIFQHRGLEGMTGKAKSFRHATALSQKFEKKEPIENRYSCGGGRSILKYLNQF